MVTATALVSKLRVASYTISAAASPNARRNASGSVRSSRIFVRVCCTNGCAMTVTFFTVLGKGPTSGKKTRRQVMQAGAEFRQVEAKINLHALRV